MKKLLVLLSLISFCFAGTYSGGSGTVDDPYQIATIGDLRELAYHSSDWDRQFIQTADIDASETETWDSGAGWRPIGNATTHFKGDYYGQGHMISGLYINRPTEDRIGLFGHLDTHVNIHDLGVHDVNITGQGSVGGIAGYAYWGCDISNCSVTGNIAGRGSVGGVLGYGYYSITVNNCFSKGIVIGSTSSIGGIAGACREYVEIRNCYNMSTVTGDSLVGGITGRVVGDCVIRACYNAGLISANSNVGGVVGELYYPSRVLSSYWDINTTGLDSSNYATGLTTEEMKNSDSYHAGYWDFETIWRIEPVMNNGYPFFRWEEQRYIPEVETDSINNIWKTSATVNCSVTDNGFPATEYGLCWSYDDDPDINDNKIMVGHADSAISFSYDMSSLNTNTVHYVRAYAVNFVDTVYGEVLDFRTYETPALSNLRVEDIDTALCYPHVYVEVGYPYATRFGFIWRSLSDETEKYYKLNFGNYYYDQDIYFRFEYLDLFSIPLEPGAEYEILAYVQNVNDTIYSDTITFKMLGRPSVSTDSIGNIENTAATIFGTINDAGNPVASQHGFCWSTDVSPTINDHKIELGSIESGGAYSSEINGLTENETYYVRTYAVNNVGTVYGNILNFKTLGKSSFSNVSVTDIDTVSAILSAEMTVIGNPVPTEHGFGWKEEEDPDNAYTKIYRGEVNSTGIFSTSLIDLNPNKHYDVYAFIVTEGDTLCSDTTQFGTLGKPSISTVSVQSVGLTSAVVNFRIDESGNPGSIQHGVCWSTDIQPGIEDNKIELGSVDSLGDFSTTITGLSQDTRYYVRAYATNDLGTIYGDTLSFITLCLPGVNDLTVSDFDTNSVNVTATITALGNPSITEHGFAWTEDDTLKEAYHMLFLGNIDSLGEFSVGIDELSANISYKVFAFAINLNDTVTTDTIRFRTLGLPKLEDIKVTVNDTSEATVSAKITSWGNPAILEHGFVWAEEGVADTAFKTILLGGVDSLSTFFAKINDLTPNTTYKVFAFAVNEVDTVHTDTVSFTTLCLPAFSNITVTSIDTSSAMMNAVLSQLGNPPALQFGFCWNNTGFPTTEDTKIILEEIDSTAIFGSKIDNLLPNTTYYVRAFARNIIGTIYSDTLSFTTLETSIDDMIPDEFSLSQNYPNPFNPTTTMEYALPEIADVHLIVFDVMGRKVREWQIKGQNSGWYKLIWDGTDLNGKMVSTGIYIYRIHAGDFIDTKKMLFVK